LDALIITTTEEHECSGRNCSKRILVGDKAIKAPPIKGSVKARYYHAETCWPPAGKGARK
jgi:hypothetical protein